jgi:UPF0271 protein
MKVDLNCDMGESYGRFKIGNDAEVMKHITSCNIACGFHGGDPLTIQHTIADALKSNVNIGAHPSFPDLQGFGRREMSIQEEELVAIIKYQIAAVKGMVEAAGEQLVHVKPHGALYNLAARDMTTALAVVEAIRGIDENLTLFGPPNSCLARAAGKGGLSFWNEVFADRNYNDDLSLVSRQEHNALIKDKHQMYEHVERMLLTGKVKTIEGNLKDIKADTICIHGDQPGAAEVAAFLIDNLLKNG